jgi:hypothetical protein
MALLSVEQQQIFIQTEQGLALYDIKSCGTDDAPVEIYRDVFGIPSPDLRFVAYVNRPSVNPGDDRFVVIRAITNGKKRTIGIGDYPAWSRDSQWLAYVGTDGLYVSNVIGDSKSRRIILYPNPYPYHDNSPTYEGGDYSRIPPEISWSPDGKWLVYHRWTGTDSDTGVDPAYNAIYKLNVETREEIKVIDGGMYPYWRWPAKSRGNP